MFTTFESAVDCLSSRLEELPLNKLALICQDLNRPALQRIAAVRVIESRWEFDSPLEAQEAETWARKTLCAVKDVEAVKFSIYLKHALRDFADNCRDFYRDCEYASPARSYPCF
jgi:hypothetical protein